MCVYDHSHDTPSLGKARKIHPAENNRRAKPEMPDDSNAPTPRGGGRREDPPKPPAPPGLPDDPENPDRFERRFVLVFRNGVLHAAYYTASEVEPKTGGDYDLDIDLVGRTFLIRKSDGTPRLLQGTVAGIGGITLQELFKFLRMPGAVLPPAHWIAMNPIYDPAGFGSSLAPVIARIRKLFFGEQGSQHFLVTAKPLAYGWNHERSYRVIALTDRWWDI